MQVPNFEKKLYDQLKLASIQFGTATSADILPPIINFAN